MPRNRPPMRKMTPQEIQHTREARARIAATNQRNLAARQGQPSVAPPIPGAMPGNQQQQGLQSLQNLQSPPGMPQMATTPLGTPSFWKGAGPQAMYSGRFTPSQMSIINQLSQSIPGLLERAQAPGSFEKTANLAMKNWQQQVLPHITNAYTGTSPETAQSMATTSGLGLMERLAALGEQAQGAEAQRAAGLLGLLSQIGLAPQFETSIIGAQPGFLQSAGTSLAGGLGQGIGYAGANWLTGGGGLGGFGGLIPEGASKIAQGSL